MERLGLISAKENKHPMSASAHQPNCHVRVHSWLAAQLTELGIMMLDSTMPIPVPP